MKTILDKTYRRLLYFRRELIAYALYKFKKSSPEQVRVVLFAQGRTGSTLLESLICAPGDFQRNGELLNISKGEVIAPSKFVRGLARRTPEKHFIFHVKIYQLTRDRKRPVYPSQFLDALLEDEWQVIYLKRRNKVRHELSNLVAEARGNYFKFDKKEEDLILDVDLDSFVERVKDRFRFERGEEKILMGKDFLQIVYEDDLENSENHQETVNRIYDYLKIERKKVSSEYKKVNIRPLDKLISNYNEFEKRMIKEGWGEFLD